MKLSIAEDIVPIGELKTQTAKVLRRLQTSRRPIVITQNGRPTAVILSPREFDRLNEREAFLDSVHRGLADSDANRLIESSEVERALDQEFGPVDPVKP
jgi:prevent-host-death family protein